MRKGLVAVCVLAFAAMCVQDIMGTVMVVFEAKSTSGFSTYAAVMAGLFDVGGFLAGLVCSALAIESIISNGWRNRRSLALIGSVSAANFLGTIAGVAIAVSLSHH